jgi:DNA modification methylase
LDPYLGSGTTLSVAARLGRLGTGIDANPRALHIARQRLAKMGIACGEASVNRPAEPRATAPRSSRKLRVA